MHIKHVSHKTGAQSSHKELTEQNSLTDKIVEISEMMEIHEKEHVLMSHKKEVITTASNGLEERTMISSGSLKVVEQEDNSEVCTTDKEECWSIHVMMLISKHH